MNTVEPFPGIMRPRPEADQTSPSSAELRMTGAESPLPLLVSVWWTRQRTSDKLESERKYMHFGGNLVQNGIFAYSFVLPL